MKYKNGRVAFCSAVLAMAIGSGASSAYAGNGYTSITNFTTTNNIQTTLIKDFPTGTFTTANAFATPFDIPSGVSNFGETSDGPVTAAINLPDVTNVYTLINAYGPVAGDTIGTLTFNFSDGTSVSEALTAGYNVRDFYQGSYANSITAPNVLNAFTFTDEDGGGYTGNVNTGPVGTYVSDEQDWVLSDPSTLLSATLNMSGNNGAPILLGITAQQSVPEPTNAARFLAIAVTATLGSRNRRRAART